MPFGGSLYQSFAIIFVDYFCRVVRRKQTHLGRSPSGLRFGALIMGILDSRLSMALTCTLSRFLMTWWVSGFVLLVNSWSGIKSNSRHRICGMNLCNGTGYNMYQDMELQVLNDLLGSIPLSSCLLQLSLHWFCQLQHNMLDGTGSYCHCLGWWKYGII